MEPNNEPKRKKSPAELTHFHELQKRAFRSSLCERGLYDPEQLAYLFRWQEALNPEKKLMKGVYAAMGSDITTPLVVMNAEEVTGIDMMPWNSRIFDPLLAEWVKTGTVGDSIEHNMQLRRSAGYMESLRMFAGQVSREATLLGELYALGVDPKTIAVERVHHTEPIGFSVPDERVVRFVWGETPAECAPRTVRIFNSTYIVAEALAGVMNTPVDFYIEKTVGRVHGSSYELTSYADQILQNGLRPHGVMLVSPANDVHEPAEHIAERANELMNIIAHAECREVLLPESVSSVMKKYYTHKCGFPNPYAWSMIGAIKK